MFSLIVWGHMNEAQLSTHTHTHTHTRTHTQVCIRSSNSLWRQVVIHTLDLPSAFYPLSSWFSLLLSVQFKGSDCTTDEQKHEHCLHFTTVFFMSFSGWSPERYISLTYWCNTTCLLQHQLCCETVLVQHNTPQEWHLHKRPAGIELSAPSTHLCAGSCHLLNSTGCDLLSTLISKIDLKTRNSGELWKLF